jgi:hypothetical protein
MIRSLGPQAPLVFGTAGGAGIVRCEAHEWNSQNRPSLQKTEHCFPSSLPANGPGAQ